MVNFPAPCSSTSYHINGTSLSTTSFSWRRKATRSAVRPSAGGHVRQPSLALRSPSFPFLRLRRLVSSVRLAVSESTPDDS